MKRIHIARLEVRLRGIGAPTAEAMVRVLGPDLAQGIIRKDFGGLRHIDQGTLDVGTIRLPRSSSPDAIKTAVVESTVGAVARTARSKE